MGSPLLAGNRQSYNMGLPTVEKCCACLELKTGTLIIGTLSLIGSCILGIIAIVGLIGSSWSHLASCLLAIRINRVSEMQALRLEQWASWSPPSCWSSTSFTSP